MIDFTIDEIRDLLDAVFISAKPRELYNKLKSFIEDYEAKECPEVRDINSIESCPRCGHHHD